MTDASLSPSPLYSLRQGITGPISAVLGLERHATMLSLFYVGSGGSNSGPYPYTMSTLATESVPQLLCNIYLVGQQRSLSTEQTVSFSKIPRKFTQILMFGKHWHDPQSFLDLIEIFADLRNKTSGLRMYDEPLSIFTQENSILNVPASRFLCLIKSICPG